MRRKRILRLVLIAIPALVAGSCNPNSTGNRLRSPSDRAVSRWLTCEECLAGELDSVTASGGATFGRLISSLKGPPDSVLARSRISAGDAFVRARRAFDRLSPADRLLRPLTDSATFVERQVSNFSTTYSTRAARAAFIIDPARARTNFSALINADTTGALRPLNPAFRQLLDSLATVPP